MNILFPSHPFSIGEPDPSMAQEYNVAKSLGHNVMLFDYDKFIRNEGLKVNFLEFTQPINAVYIGWMMNMDQYLSLLFGLDAMNCELIFTQLTL